MGSSCAVDCVSSLLITSCVALCFGEGCCRARPGLIRRGHLKIDAARHATGVLRTLFQDL